MDPILILLVVLLAITYSEGALFALVVTQFTKTKCMWKIITIFLWPILIPYMVYKIYLTYAPMIKEMQTNPMLQALMGINQVNYEIETNKEIDTTQ